MIHDEKAREHAARFKALLQRALPDGFVFAVGGGRRTAYKLILTVLAQTFRGLSN